MKITAWRIVQARQFAAAFSGVGARLYPGRWNERGTPLIYTAGSLSLAVMELLVHLDTAEVLNQYLYMPVSFDEKLCNRLAMPALPPDWAVAPAPLSTRAIGAAWVNSGSSVVLAVPSAVIHIETVYLINPQHPRFKEVQIGAAHAFQFDARLVKK